MASGDRIDWDDLRYFLRAAEAKTLSGAARELGVEHTTLGRRLSSLERALGAALVTRGPAGLGLTALGERVLPLAAEMGRAAEAVGELVASERSRVRLVLPSGFMSLLTPHLAALRRDEPRLSLEIVSGSRPVDLRRDEADLAVRVGPVGEDDLVARKLGEVGWAPYASRAYLARRPAPAGLDDLSGHDVVGFHRALAKMPAAQWLEARSAGASVVVRSREAVDMLVAARDGAGVAVLPCFLGDAEPSLARLTPGAVAARRLSLVYGRRAHPSGAVRAAARFVVGVLRARADQLRGGPGPPPS